MNLFGRKKKAPAPKLSSSIQQLRGAMQVLDKREKHLEKQITQCLKEAKRKSKAKDKRGALHQLKRKKMLEKQVDQIYGKKSNIEMQIMALESAASNKELLAAMKTGKNALRAAVGERDVDDVADVMDEINDAVSMADELGEAMAQPMGVPMDEDDLMDELKDLEAEMMDDELLDAEIPTQTNTVAAKPQTNDALTALPAAPSSALVGSEKEAAELAELEALMNT